MECGCLSALDVMRHLFSNGLALLSVAALVICVATGTGMCVDAASPPAARLETLTTAHAAHSLTEEEAARAYPVHIKGVVTYFDRGIDPRRIALFVHDETGGIFVALPFQPFLPIRPGTLLDITGVTGAGDFAPIVDRPIVKIIGQSHLPDRAPLVSLTHLLTGAEDGQWVEVEGVGSSMVQRGNNVFIEIETGDGRLSAATTAQPGVDYSGLIDAEVRVRGVAAPIFGKKAQMLSVRLFFQTLDQWRILKPAPPDPFALPVRPIATMLRYAPGISVRHRVHVRGQVTLLWPGQSICVQDQTQGICVETAQTSQVALGDWVDLAGFPAAVDYKTTMTDAVYRSARSGQPVKPRSITVRQALSSDHDSEVVQLTGELIGQELGAREPTLLLSAGPATFSLILRSGTPVDSLTRVRPGSQLQVTGICSVLIDGTQTKLHAGPLEVKSFRLLLRSPADIVILRTPSWWTAGRALLVLGLVAALTIVVAGWGVILRRRVRQQTEVIRRQLSEAAALQDAAESANRAKGEFLANMSHEIRTPMNGVMGMIDLALEDSVSDEQRDYLALARDSAATLLTVINDILDFSKIEAGRLDLVPASFNLRELLDQIARGFARRAAEKNIALYHRVHEDVPALVIADRIRICQVITNLVGNAVKFTERGEVSLDVFLKERIGRRDTLAFVVSDTGIGIPVDSQATIFDSFAQVDSSLSRSYGGTGLGLAISSNLVKLMGGSISVDSAPGKGSRFHFTIEVERAGEVGVEPAPKGPDSCRDTRPLTGRPAGLQVLLAEDNEVNQKVIRMMLENRGHTVTVANNGRRAIDLSERCAFDVVLMDVSMPVMDGFEATAAIRRREQGSGSRLPIVALTAHAMTGDKERCLAAGMDGYLAKPIKAHQIVDAMKALLPDAAAV